MAAKSGDPLVEDSAVDAYRRSLLPLAELVTPNAFEAARLVGGGGPMDTEDWAEEAAREIVAAFGSAACLVKGIRRGGRVVDVLFDGHATHRFEHDECRDGGTHGSGCCLSAAVAACFAHGLPRVEAVAHATDLTHRAIAAGLRTGRGTPVVNPSAWITPHDVRGRAAAGHGEAGGA